MKHEKRTKKLLEIERQMDFIAELMARLRKDIAKGADAQDSNPYDNWSYIQGHTRYADDAVRIRREVLTLSKMLREG